MKKFFALLLLVVALGGFSIGCGSAPAPLPAEGDTADTADSETGTDTGMEETEPAAPAEG